MAEIEDSRREYAVIAVSIDVALDRVPTRSGKSWKIWKIMKTSSMHGKIMEFEKNLNDHGKMMEFCEII